MGTHDDVLDPRALRERLGHPVIDGDGHTVEYRPALHSYLLKEGITSDDLRRQSEDIAGGLEHRLNRRAARRSALWHSTENTTDLATAQIPKLLYNRLAELGIDFGMVFATGGQSYVISPDEVFRRPACRALNDYMMDMYGEYSDRLYPVAVVPMYTPEEAIDELEYAVARGFKAVQIGGYAIRPTPGAPRNVLRQTGWLDTFGIDSLHDYDPFWARCVHHGIAPAAHQQGMNFGTRRSPTNYVYNQIGHFAATGEALTKSLVMGGVVHRFPELRFGILEGGVGWATQLYADLINRWEKRNRQAIEKYMKSKVDQPLFSSLIEEYGPELLDYGEPVSGSLYPGGESAINEEKSDFDRSGITKAEDLVELFADRFYFGCEADDRATKIAFDRDYNPYGVEIKTIFSSDIGHWDVPDFRGVLHEAYELVEHGWVDDRQFRDFTFANAVKFYTSNNPSFFDGTAIADAARDVVGSTQAVEREAT